MLHHEDALSHLLAEKSIPGGGSDKVELPAKKTNP